MPADHGTKRLGRGLLTATHSQNGKLRDQVPSYGLLGNVSYHPALTFSHTLIVFPFVAGAGKSVFWYANVNPFVFHPFGLTLFASSAIIEDIETMRKSGDASIAMYFYDFRDDLKKKDLRELLSSILFQLFEQSNYYYNILSTFHSTHHGAAQSPRDEELVQYLVDLVKLPGPPPVYLIVDGLDESPNTSTQSFHREQVLSFLDGLVKAQLPNLRLCVASRPEVDIKAILEPLSFHSVFLENESGQKKDIEDYIESIVHTEKNMKSWNPKHKQLVIDALTKKADGM